MFCVPRTVYAALLHISSPCHATQGCKLDDDTKTWAMPDGRSGIVGGGGRGRGPGLATAVRPPGVDASGRTTARQQ